MEKETNILKNSRKVIVNQEFYKQPNFFPSVLHKGLHMQELRELCTRELFLKNLLEGELYSSRNKDIESVIMQRQTIEQKSKPV